MNKKEWGILSNSIRFISFLGHRPWLYCFHEVHIHFQVTIMLTRSLTQMIMKLSSLLSLFLQERPCLELVIEHNFFIGTMHVVGSVQRLVPFAEENGKNTASIEKVFKSFFRVYFMNWYLFDKKNQIKFEKKTDKIFLLKNWCTKAMCISFLISFSHTRTKITV